MTSLLKRSFFMFLLLWSAQSMFAAQDDPSVAEIRRILQDRVDSDKKSVGIVVGVVSPGGSKIVSYGKVSQDGNQVPDGDTLFEIGSITKVFTSLLLADMVEHGEVSFSDPIAKFLPRSVKVPSRNGKEITLLDLATQTSGLPRLPDNLAPKDMSNPYADYTVEQMYAFLSRYVLTRDIGSSYEYSNFGVGLLGHTLALKAGTDYEVLVKTRVCVPLQMNSTRIHLAPDLQSRLAGGHDDAGKTVGNWDLPTLAGAGALRSTANDLLRFLAANLQLVKSDLYPAMRRTHETQKATGMPDLSIGLGWHLFSKYGTEIIWHNGGTGGNHSFIGFDKKRQMGVTVLSNSVNDIDDIGFHLLENQYSLTKFEPPKQRRELVLEPEITHAYVGQYQLAPNFVLTITQDGRRLMAQATGQPKVEVFRETETNFVCKAVDAQISFKKNDQGQVTELILHQNGQDMPAKTKDKVGKLEHLRYVLQFAPPCPPFTLVQLTKLMSLSLIQ